jgi:hypothetical protein
VREAAVSTAVGYGDPRRIPNLYRIALAGRTPPRTRAAAWDAIGAIKIRYGLTEAPVGPHAGRLTPVPRPAGDEPIRALYREPPLGYGTSRSALISNWPPAKSAASRLP